MASPRILKTKLRIDLFLLLCYTKTKDVISLKIKTAIFDMDGTLVDSLMLWDILWTTFGEKYLSNKGFLPREEDDKKVRTLTLKEAMVLIHEHYNLGESAEELSDLTNSIMMDFYANKVELKKGVREFLEYLYSQGIKMCIASATETKLIEVAMKHCDIEKYFCKVFSCADIGKGKEEPDVFLVAKNYFGTSLEETWVFEDSVAAIETVTKIGMKTVGIYDRFNFGQERIKEIANEYIAEGETLLKLIKE